MPENTVLNETVNLHTEAIANGEPIELNQKLGDIFDKAEELKATGKGTVEDAIKQVMEPEQKPEVKPEQKPEEKTEQKQETKPEAKTEEVEKKEEKKSDELVVKKEEVSVETPEEEKEIENPKTKTERRINHLLKRIKDETGKRTTTEKTAAEKDAKIAAYEKELTELRAKTAGPTPEHQKIIDEHAMYRRQYELENSEELKQKFDSQVEAAEKNITSILKENGLSDATLKKISEAGGFAKWSKDRTEYPQADGTTKTASQFAREWLDALPLADSEAIRAAMQKQVLTRQEREAFIAAEKSKAKEYFAKKQTEDVGAMEKLRSQVEQNKNVLNNWYNKAINEVEFLKEPVLPENANEAQKKEFAETQKFNNQLRGLLKKTLELDGSNLQDLVDTALDSVRYYAEQAKAKRLEERVKILEEENTKLKNAGRTVPKAGSSTPPTNETIKEKKITSFDDALAAIEAGKSLE